VCGRALRTSSSAGGQASYRTHYSTIGIHSITVVYSGDANNSGGTAGYEALSNGSAAFSIPSLPPGSHSIAAAFEGSGAFEPSDSASLNQVVNTVPTTTLVASSSDPVQGTSRLKSRSSRR